MLHTTKRSLELYSCLKHLGFSQGWRYWRIQAIAAKDPALITGWISRLRATAATTSDQAERDSFTSFADLLEKTSKLRTLPTAAEKTISTGLTIMLIAIVFNLGEGFFHGFHLFPQDKIDLQWNAITLIVGGLGATICMLAKRQIKTNYE